MSDKDDPLEFSALDLMPDWAQESKTPDKPKTYQERPDRGGDRGDRRGGGGGGNRQGRGRDHRDSRGGQGRGGGGNRDFDRGRGGPRQGRGGRDDRRGGGRGRGGRDDRRGGGGRFNRDRPPLEPVPEHVAATLEPTEAAAKALAKHIIESVRTFPLIDLAKMVLSQRERYQVRFKSTDPDKFLYQCLSDRSAWLTKEEAIAHALNSHALETYYQVEEIDTDPPKGNFNAVAVCGMSGEILGPSNHHEYQKNIAKIHAERFSNMSLERYKSRITMANDEETIEKWKTQMSRKRQYRLKSESPEEAPEETETEPVEEEASETANETEEATIEPAEEAIAETESTEEQAEESSEDEPAAESTEEDSEEAAPDAEAEAETEPESEPTAADETILESEEALNRHFRENFADKEIAESKVVVVSGNVPAKDLSRGLLEHLKRESEKLRRGFPLPMIQALCKAFEREHLKFFKRGKKALHVSPVRPKAIAEGQQLTDRIQKIVDFIDEKTRPMVVDLLDHLVEEFQKPDPKAKEKAPELTDKAKEVLNDLRWLTGEGFVLEFPNTRLELGKKPGGHGQKAQNQPQGAPKKKAARKERPEGEKRERKPAEATETPNPAAEEEATSSPATETPPTEAKEKPAAETPSAEPEVAAEEPVEAESEEPPSKSDETG